MFNNRSSYVWFGHSELFRSATCVIIRTNFRRPPMFLEGRFIEHRTFEALAFFNARYSNSVAPAYCFGTWGIDFRLGLE